MKLKIVSVIFLSLLLHRVEAAPAFPAPPNIPQEQFGIKLIHEMLYGDTASLATYFEDSVKANLTQEVLEGTRAQITWLSKLIGDSLEQFMSGNQPLDSLGKQKAFFREYRLANELNKRNPLMLVHIWFKDSTTNKAAGAFVRPFADNSEKRLANEQTWNINGKRVDVNAIVLVQFQQGSMLAIEVFDDDTTTLDSVLVKKKGVPIIRKAIAEGFLDTAKKAGGTLLDNIGICFIRKDPNFGFEKLKFGIKPEDYLTAAELKKKSKPSGKSKPRSKKTN